MMHTYRIAGCIYVYLDINMHKAQYEQKSGDKLGEEEEENYRIMLVQYM
jgi:hypothetical protein